MKKKIYLETTIFSFYYDERAESSYRRKVTRDWWDHERRNYDFFTSYFTVKEINNPVYPNWRKVLALARRVKLLKLRQEIDGIIEVYMKNKLMPADDTGDAAHLAIASYYETDYLLTWNCKHLANANKFDHIRIVNMKLGLLTPEIVTPEQLYEEK